MRWMPHGQCVNWDPLLIAGEVMSDLIIALAYFTIPIALIIIARRYPKFKASPVLWMFAAFIVSCGMTHIMSVITVWVPVYLVSVWVSILTALASIVAAAFIWIKSPMLVDYLPDPEGLRGKSGSGPDDPKI